MSEEYPLFSEGDWVTWNDPEKIAVHGISIDESAFDKNALSEAKERFGDGPFLVTETEEIDKSRCPLCGSWDLTLGHRNDLFPLYRIRILAFLSRRIVALAAIFTKVSDDICDWEGDWGHPQLVTFDFAGGSSAQTGDWFKKAAQKEIE